MIECRNVTRKFGRICALDAVSISIAHGTVNALVGGNGAGKTTLLRMIASLAAPTTGTITVDNRDTVADAYAVRRQIGYLAEDVPLYDDMRICDFLRHRAGLKGVSMAERGERVAEVMDQCGLHGVERQMIGSLSKGYRKRVGVAEALVHAPPVLLLDEPTVGLDQTHIDQIDQLIASLSSRHTVIFSTHFIEEAVRAGAQPMVLDRGRLVAGAAVANGAGTRSAAPRCYVELRGPRDIIMARLKMIPNVITIQIEGDGVWNRFLLDVEIGRDVRPDIFALASENRWIVRELRMVGAADAGQTGSGAAHE